MNRGHILTCCELRDNVKSLFLCSDSQRDSRRPLSVQSLDLSFQMSLCSTQAVSNVGGCPLSYQGQRVEQFSCVLGFWTKFFHRVVSTRAEAHELSYTFSFFFFTFFFKARTKLCKFVIITAQLSAAADEKS